LTAGKRTKKKKPKRGGGKLVITRRGAIVLGALVCVVLALVGFLGGRATGAPPGADPYAQTIREWARAYNVNADLVAAVVEAESSGRPRAVSPAGALGLMQLMPATAAEIARELGLDEPTREDLFEPEVNIRFGVYYLSKLRERFGDERELVIAAYHAGPTRVDAWRTSRADLASVDVVRELAFPQTRRYVERVMSLWRRKAAEAGSAP